MKENIIQLITAFLGSAGFALVFNIRNSLVFMVSVGGFFSWGLFLIFQSITANYFVASFAASAFAALYGEVMARVNKTPASVFFIPGVVSLIPGGDLFYTMSYALKSDWDSFRHYSSLTVQYALGIACGISMAWALWYMLQKFITSHKPSENFNV
ncbi:MAG: threonine/serine exporter family protein [Clostridia bacterium]|nr:threonine/serine exporter family protein [Clostridia bacterium]